MRISHLISAAALVASSSATNITYARANESFVENNKLPPSHATSDGAAIVQLFTNLSRDTKWSLVSKTVLEGDTGEPEGMIRLSHDRFFVSSGQWIVPTQKYGRTINGTDRTTGAGFAHMLIYNAQGTLIANASLSEPGETEYHPSGIDYDGRYVWVSLAEYRPNSTANVVRIDPLTLEQATLFRVADHSGGIVHDTVTDDLISLNWGSRNATTFNFAQYPRGFAPAPEFTAPERAFPNPSHFVDYQDCKFLGHHALPSTIALARNGGKEFNLGTRPIMFCGGVATIPGSTTNLGGLALVDMQTMLPLYEVPIGLKTDEGANLVQNPVDVAVVDGKLRIYAMPDQHNSTMYVYEAL